MAVTLQGVARAQPIALQGHDAPASSAPGLEIGFGPTGARRLAQGGGPAPWFGFLRPMVAACLFGAAAFGFGSAQAQGVALPVKDTSFAAVSGPLAQGFLEVLQADQDGDQKVLRLRLHDELANASPLAQAIFAYANYVNPGARASPWGEPGGYLVGGITFRPTHMTANGLLLNKDLEAIWGPLQLRLASPLGAGMIADDLRALHDLHPEASWAEIHQASERVISTLHEALRSAGRYDSQPFSQAELSALFAEGSLPHSILQVTAGHGADHYATALRDNPSLDRRAAAGDREAVSSAQQQYLYSLGKRAQEASLLEQIRAALP